MPFKIILISVCFLLVFSNSATALEQDKGKEYLARWEINYAAYLIEIGKYMEALENYDSAIELTSLNNTKIDALLAKATLLASFLDAPNDAGKVYQDIVAHYPGGAEIALYREGLVLYDLDQRQEAKEVLDSYLVKYPQGRFRYQVEALIEMLKRVLPPSRPPPIMRRPKMRVLISRGSLALTIASASAKQQVCAEGLDCESKFSITSRSGQVLVNGEQQSQKSFRFESKDNFEINCEDKSKQVRGELLVAFQKGKFYVINSVDIEDYLLSVVPSESYASWPQEALKAQAVAARTYAYYQVLHRKQMQYDVVDDEGDQVYGGIGREHARTTQAVLATEGRILWYAQKPILAMYSANSGGYTADAGSIFGLTKPYLIAQPDPSSLGGQMAYWTRSYSMAEIEAALARIGIPMQGIKNIEPARRGPSGRIIRIRIECQSSTKTINTRTSMRRALKLPEILFEIKKKAGGFVFKGRGFGHGVGYSQWGAAIMGDKKKYPGILQFYYPGAEIVKMW